MGERDTQRKDDDFEQRNEIETIMQFERILDLIRSSTASDK